MYCKVYNTQNRWKWWHKGWEGGIAGITTISHCLFDICCLTDLSKSTCLKPNCRSSPFRPVAPKSSPISAAGWQTNPPNFSGWNPWNHFPFLPLISSAYSIFKLHFQHCHHLGLSHHHLSRGLLQKNPNKCPSLHMHPLVNYSPHSNQGDPDKLKSDHVTPLLKTLQWLPVSLKVKPMASQCPKRP